MARDHTEELKKETPQVLERVINLTLINEKLNEITNLLYAMAEKAGVQTKEED